MLIHKELANNVKARLPVFFGNLAFWFLPNLLIISAFFEMRKCRLFHIIQMARAR